MSREAWIVVGVIAAVIAVVTLVGAVKLGLKLVRTKRMLGELGTGGKVAFYGALLYAIFPIDLLPDPIYLDDMAVLGSALFYLNKLLRSRGGLRGLVPQRGRQPVAPGAPRPKP
jgi:hypothetical protein